MQAQGIKSIKSLGIQDTLDFEVNHEDHNFYAEGIIVSNSHAMGYGALTSITGYLKANHTKEFFLSLLKAAKNEQNTLEEISVIEKEMNQLGIKLLPPNIFKSELNFSIQPEGILMGLGNIKGIAEKAVAKLDKFRHPFANKFDIFQSAEEAKIPINILSVLIGVGAMDGLYKQSRSWCILEASLWTKLTTKEKIWAQKLGEENDWDLLKIVPKLKELKDDKGKVIIKESRFETIKKAYAPYKEIYRQNSAYQDFTDWVMSVTYLGFSHGKTLKDIFIEKRPGLINLAELKEKFNEDRVAFVGQIIDVMKGTSKKGNKYIKFLVADETSQFGAWIFKDAIEQCEELNGGQLPKEGDFVIVRGTKKGKDSVFAEVVAVQKNNVLLKTSQVKETEEDTDFAPVSNIIFARKLDEEEENIN